MSDKKKKRTPWQKSFIKGFTGSEPEDEKPEEKESFQERHRRRMANMSEAEKAERERKIKEQGMKYECGGIVKKKKDYFSKIKSKLKK